MKLTDWDERYRNAPHEVEEPTRLVVEQTLSLEPGRALDLACGMGRNALYLASRGWQVTGVDGAPAAIERIRLRSSSMRAVAADLEAHEFVIEPGAWDLILTAYYLQRDLFTAIKSGLKPGGVAIAIVHIPNPGEGPAEKRAAPGELRGFFEDWEILHYYEGAPRDEAHKRPVAEIAARKPLSALGS